MIRSIIPDDVIKRVRSLINGARDIVITCHLSPDGDAVGSTLGLCHVLRRLGKNANVVTADMVPRSLHFVPGVRDITVMSINESLARRLVSEAQLIFCLDFNTMSRIDKLGECIEGSRAPRVLIDHHLDPDNQFDVMISYPEASSTAELVFRVLMQLRMLNMVDKVAAQCLYLGLMTDTGNFTFGCENPELYEIQAVLMRRRIDKQWLYNMAMNTFSADCLRLRGYALNEKMVLDMDHGVSLITLSLDELRQFNYRKGDTEGLVNVPLAIPGIYWSVFLRQEEDRVRVSCRSIGNFTVNDICARYFNGGGHANAAGGDYYGTLDGAVEQFHRILKELDENNNDN